MCRRRNLLLEVKPQTKLLNDLLVLTGPGLLDGPDRRSALVSRRVELILPASDVKGLRPVSPPL